MRRAHKDRLKRSVKRAMRWVGRWLPRRPASRILTYHSVGHRGHEMNVTPADFEAQMRWLVRHHPVITLEEAAAGVPGVAITFDDGYRDNLLHAAPVLHALEIPATIFMVSDRAGGVLDGDPEPATGVLMNVDELRALRALGIQVGAHTRTHPRLARLDEAAQRDEILGSKLQLEALLGQNVSSFAYPYGSAADYTAVSVRLAEEAGYALAVSNRYGHNTPVADRYALRRIWIDATDTLPLFQAKVDGSLDGLRVLESALALKVRQWVNRAGR